MKTTATLPAPLRAPLRFLLAPCAALCCALATAPAAAQRLPASATSATSVANVAPDSAGPLIKLGVGDTVSVQVYGRPELNTTTYVSDDGTIPVPLAGDVQVAGLSPAKAGQRVAAAFREGKFLVDPQVTVFLSQSRSQQVSVLGAVRAPGRFPVDSKTTVVDVLAQAGGITDNGADVVVLLRPGKGGKVTRSSVDLKGLSQPNMPLPMLTVRGGDSIFVPPAEQFYVTGEVRLPSMYRLEPGMTVMQAISRGGGITPRGSSRRIEIRRQNPDGSYAMRSVQLNDRVEANDVIRVKESFF
jgi:polysaccharide export outer membrane protein